jgi:hypothetical protein
MFSSNLVNAPQDARWHGTATAYFRLFYAKNLLITIFACLTIPEGILFRRWWSYSIAEDYSPYVPARPPPLHIIITNIPSYKFWLRIGIALFPEVFFIPATVICCAMRRFHPIAALVGCIVLFALFLTAASLNSLIVASGEVSFPNRDIWERMCYAEVGLQVTIVLIYAAMGTYACKAVHRWRIARNGVLAEEELELGAVKDVGEEDVRVFR